MNRKVARPLDNGAIQRVNGIFNLPTELVNEKGETIFVLINTFNRNELFNLSNYWFSIHIKGSKYNTIETFISEEIKKLKIVQGWFDATKEKEYFFSIQHYIDYLEMNFKSDFEINNERNIKNEIAIKLIGLIEGDTTVFHYIKRVLKEYNITAIEGREILLEMQGTFSDALRIKRLPEVVKFLEDIKALPPQQNETETEQETPTFTNNFDNIKPTEIYNHFKAGLVEKGYLTEQELNEYLKAAFELQTKPEILFKLKHTPTKQKIYTVFYIYYKDISQKKHERQKEYAALLGDFFEGYKTEIIQTNWARDYKTKR